MNEKRHPQFQWTAEQETNKKKRKSSKFQHIKLYVAIAIVVIDVNKYYFMTLFFNIFQRFHFIFVVLSTISCSGMLDHKASGWKLVGFDTGSF